MNYFEVRRDFVVEGDGPMGDNWWTDDAIAAWEFIGSFDDMGKDKTGHGYNLNLTGEFIHAEGYNHGISFGPNAKANNWKLNKMTDLKTIIVRYATLPMFTRLAYAKGVSNSPSIVNPCLYYGLAFMSDRGPVSIHKPVILSQVEPPAASVSTVNGIDDWVEVDYPPIQQQDNNYTVTYYVPASDRQCGSGVLACTNKKIFFNGEDLGAVKTTAKIASGQQDTFGEEAATLLGAGSDYVGSIIAAAFYNKVLSDQRIKDISAALLLI